MKSLTLIASILLAGCGSNALQGTVGGQDLAPQDAVVTVVQDTTGSGFVQAWVSSKANFCSAANSTNAITDTLLIIVQLGVVAPDGSLVPGDTAGSYTLNATDLTPGQRVAEVAWYSVGGCVDDRELANSGTVEITHVKRGTGAIDELAGSIDLIFPRGRLQGDFQALGCAKVNPLASSCR